MHRTCIQLIFKSIAFALQKVAFRPSKGGLLPSKRCPFENQCGPFWSTEVSFYICKMYSLCIFNVSFMYL